MLINVFIHVAIIIIFVLPATVSVPYIQINFALLLNKQLIVLLYAAIIIELVLEIKVHAIYMQLIIVGIN